MIATGGCSHRFIIHGLVQVGMAFHAVAGEPLLTDDPGTPGPNTWEVNAAVLLVDLQDGTAWEAPALSLAYGIGSRVEVGVGLNLVVIDNEGESVDSGLGHGTVSAKWRFLDENDVGVSVSTAPAISSHTHQRSVDRGIVDSGTTVTLPVEFGKTIGPLDFYGEIGRDLVEEGSDLWFYGLAAEWPWHDRWTLVGEVYGVSLDDFDDHELLANGGMRFTVRDHLFLHGAIGAPLREANMDPTRLVAFLGVQWMF